MKVTMLLADAVQTAEGKLNILGGGWSVIGPSPTPSAIALKISVSWPETASSHTWQLRLVTEDGDPVAPKDGNPVELSGTFDTGRPPGAPPGMSLDVPIAINLGPFPLEPGSRFEWRLDIDGQHHEDWCLPFTTRSRPA